MDALKGLAVTRRILTATFDAQSRQSGRAKPGRPLAPRAAASLRTDTVDRTPAGLHAM